MSPNSGYKRQINALRRVRTGIVTFKKPIQKEEILGKPPVPSGIYQISESTNILTPKSLPKNGDLVLVEEGVCPRNMETNIVYVKDLSDKAFIYDAWIPSYKFFLLQVVIFWKNDTQYEYQIQHSDNANPKICKFVLMSKKGTTQQPGGSYRVPQKTKIVS